MIDGFFHADPHPGNVVVELANGRLTFLDAGMVAATRPAQADQVRPLPARLSRTRTSRNSVVRSARSAEPFREPDESAYQREFERRIGPLIDKATTSRANGSPAEARLRGPRHPPRLRLPARRRAHAGGEGGRAGRRDHVGARARSGWFGLRAVGRRSARGAGSPKHSRATPSSARRASGQSSPPERSPSAYLRWKEQRVAGSTSWLEERSPSASPLRLRPGLPGLRLESVARLIAAAALLTGLLIGSAIAGDEQRRQERLPNGRERRCSLRVPRRRQSPSHSSSCFSGGSSAPKAGGAAAASGSSGGTRPCGCTRRGSRRLSRSQRVAPTAHVEAADGRRPSNPRRAAPARS